MARATRPLLLLASCALGIFSAPALAAPAGEVVFASERCADEADNERRPNPAPGFAFECRGAIWIVADDGSNLRRVSDGGSRPYEGDREPSWSPNGSRIAFETLRLSTRTGGGATPFDGAQFDSGISVMRRDGSGVREVTSSAPPGPGQFIANMTPSWSPDGRTLLFASNRPTGDPSLGYDFNVYTVKADGSDLTQITSSPEHEFEPSFAPDGESIIFTRGIAGERLPPGSPPTAAQISGQGVYRRDLDTGAERQLTASDLSVPWGAVFSPDGEQIAFSLPAGADFGYIPLLYTMRSDGTDLRRRTAASASQPTFAGDSSTLIYSRPGLDETTWGSYTLDQLDLSEPGVAPVALTTPWRHSQAQASYGRDASPSWRTLRDRPGVVPETVDRLPPTVKLIDWRSGRRVGTGRPMSAATTSARGPGPAVQARNLAYFAADRNGIRSIEIAVARRQGRRCRHFGAARVGPPKSCARALFRPLGAVRGWRRVRRRLTPGAYVIRFRTRDRRANKSGRTPARYLRIR